MDKTIRYEDLPDIMNVDEAAEFLRLARSSVYEAIRQKQIVSVRIGKRILIPKSALLQLFQPAIQQGE